MLSLTFASQLLLGLLLRVQAAPISPPYSGAQLLSIGQINDITLNDPTDFVSGGTITVDGILYIVPRNGMVVTPNQNVMFSEMFIDGVVQMPLWPDVGWEAAVYANEVNGSNIIGLLFIQQESARIITGFISQIDHETGLFNIGGNSSEVGSGIVARINDPVGRYGLPYTENPLWASDTENPSITSISGMPLCIERPLVGNATSDPLCPSKNRPKKADGSAHTMINFLPAAQRTESDPDPMFMVPLAVGDYVTVLGTIVDDTPLLSVFNLIANIGIFTPAGEMPNYMYSTRNQFAVDGPPASETGETRAVTFSTDPTTPIIWFRIDIDPCTGAQTHFNMLQQQPLQNNIPIQQPGKAQFRGGTDDFTPAPMYTGFQSDSGSVVTGNGIVAGTFISPINGFANGYIFAEVTVYGDIEFPLEFQDITFLAQGSGPYIEGVPLKPQPVNAPIIGQLDPWPGSVTPPAANCAGVTAAPIANFTVIATNASAALAAGLTRRQITPNDTIFALVAAETEVRGTKSYTVTVQDSVTTAPFPSLTLTGAAKKNPVGDIVMTNLGGGMFTTTIATHNNLDSVTIVSTFGAALTITTFTGGGDGPVPATSRRSRARTSLST